MRFIYIYIYYLIFYFLFAIITNINIWNIMTFFQLPINMHVEISRRVPFFFLLLNVISEAWNFNLSLS